MKISPIYQNGTIVYFSSFMEGAMPNPLNYDLQTVLNNMVSGRIFYGAPVADGVQSLLPQTLTAVQVSPYPAQMTVQGFRGKRVLPKVTLPTYSTQYSDLVNSGLTNTALQLDAIFSTILSHRTASTSVANITAGNAAASACLPNPRTQNADGSWTIAEYDFGADVVVNSLASFTGSATSTNLFSSNAALAITLQVQNGQTWTDVTNLTTNLVNGSVNAEKFYQLPATIQGRRFRIVSKSASQPFAAGFSWFALHFYGDYATGSAPRTLAKIQHAVLWPVAFGTSYTAPVFSNLAGVSYGRFFPHFGLSVTDDLKQAATNDVLLTDAAVYPGQEQAVASLTITNKAIVTEAF